MYLGTRVWGLEPVKPAMTRPDEALGLLSDPAEPMERGHKRLYFLAVRQKYGNSCQATVALLPNWSSMCIPL